MGIHNGHASFYGHNSEKRLHSVQNCIHRKNAFLTPYFQNRVLGAKNYNYTGGFNPNYLFY